MKPSLRPVIRTPLWLLAALAVLTGGSLYAAPFGTAFTYQGRLADAGQPANGVFEFEFGLWTALTGGTSLDTDTKAAVQVVDGLFTVELDFDPRFINGDERWLEIRVRSTNSPGFATLTPRQRLAPTPHALRARNADLAFAVPNGAITSAMLANGAVTTVNIASNSITAAQLAPGAVGAPQLVKPYEAGRVSSSALPWSFSPLVFSTNFTTAFSQPPVVNLGLEPVTTTLAPTLQTHLVSKSTSNFVAVISFPPTAPRTITTVSGNSLPLTLSAAMVLGTPAVAYAYQSCEVTEIEVCTTNITSFLGFGDCPETPFLGFACVTNIVCAPSGQFVTNNCNGGLRFARALDDAGNLLVTTTIATSGQPEQPSLALTSLPFQSPVVAYFNALNSSLQFARASLADGSTWNPPVTVVNHADVGRHCSVALVGGNPAISYYNATAAELEFIRATNSAGLFNPNARVTVGTSLGGVGRYSSLATVAGRGAIACYETNRGLVTIAFFRANDTNGTSWGARRYVADALLPVSTLRLISLKPVNGRPAVAFFDASTSTVNYIRADDPDGVNWPSATSSFSASNGDCDLAVLNGRPAILYRSGSSLRLVTAADFDGANWNTPINVPAGSVAPITAGLLANGSFPSLLYVSAGANQTLRLLSPYIVPFNLTWTAIQP